MTSSVLEYYENKGRDEKLLIQTNDTMESEKKIYVTGVKKELRLF
jgi:hypothetical protein